MMNMSILSSRKQTQNHCQQEKVDHVEVGNTNNNDKEMNAINKYVEIVQQYRR